MDKRVQRVTLLLDKELWHQVSIESAKMGIHKKEFVDIALREKINRIIEGENKQQEKNI